MTCWTTILITKLIRTLFAVAAKGSFTQGLEFPAKCENLWAVVVAQLAQSGHFRHQRSAVQIRSSANVYIERLFTVNCIEKTKIKIKEAGIRHVIYETNVSWKQCDQIERFIGLWATF